MRLNQALTRLNRYQTWGLGFEVVVGGEEAGLEGRPASQKKEMWSFIVGQGEKQCANPHTLRGSECKIQTLNCLMFRG